MFLTSAGLVGDVVVESWSLSKGESVASLICGLTVLLLQWCHRCGEGELVFFVFARYVGAYVSLNKSVKEVLKLLNIN